MKRKVLAWLTVFAIILTIPMALHFPVAAETSGNTGDCSWTLDGTKLTITAPDDSMEHWTEDYSLENPAPWGVFISEVTFKGNITKIGAYNFYDCTGLTFVSIPDSVHYIEPFAFCSCKNLLQLILGSNLWHISSEAFDGCDALSSVQIPDLSVWFDIKFHSLSSNPLMFAESLYVGNTKITSLTIPDGVTTIQGEAFYGFEGLTSLVVPEGVTEIEENAFLGCVNLTDVQLPTSLVSIGYDAFRDTPIYYDENWENGVLYLDNYLLKATNVSGDYTVKDGTILLADNSFIGCSNLTSLTCPDSLISVGERSFSGCNSLSTVKLPDQFPAINAYAFYGSKITSIELPASITSIDTYAFFDCVNLTEITVPDSVTSIDNYAFKNCTALTTIRLPDNLQSISTNAIDNTAYYNDPANWENEVLYLDHYPIKAKNTLSGSYTLKEGTPWIPVSFFENLTGLTSITIPDSVSSINSQAFRGCTGLTSATLGNGTAIIGPSAFSGCTGLTSVTIGNNTTSIGFYAFSGCTGLTSITIPKSVTFIDQSAFKGCAGLTSVAIPNNVTSVSHSAFYGCSALESVYISDFNVFENNTFNNCPALTDIYYCGTEEMLREGSVPTCLADKTWHYEAHIYTDACDTTCDLCDVERSAPHTYNIVGFDANEHWMICKDCGATSAPQAHIHPEENEHICTGCNWTNRGDLNNDGITTSADVLLLMQALNQRDSTDLTADVNNDGKISLADALRMLTLLSV